MQYPTALSANSTQTGLLTTNHLLNQRYRILAKLGRGGFGAVYKGEDVQFGNRLVAVKEMSQSGLNSRTEVDEAVDAFKREAHMLAALRHQNLPRIYDHFSDGGRWYLVMDFIEGETLAEHLKNRGGYLSVEEAIQIALQLCTVLDYLHTRQPPIVFRDLTPNNIMLTSDGHVYLIDFGIARLFKPGQAKDTAAFGSRGYAAPEQYGTAQTSPRSDIYSLGVILHQMITGNDPSQKPFRFAPPQLTGSPALSMLSSLMMQMLEMDEDRRPASMAIIKQQLQSIANQLAGKSPFSTTIPRFNQSGNGTLLPTIPITPRKKRTWALVAALIAVMVVLAFSMPALLSHHTQSPSSGSLTNSSNASVPTPTATPSPTPTLAPTPSPTPIPPTPTPTPAPKAGDVLYQADSTWSGWNGTADWKVNGGLLLNDGTYADYNVSATIVAPYQSQTADYAEEIQMQVVQSLTTATVSPCVYMTVRGNQLSNGWQGYAALICTRYEASPAVALVAYDSSNNVSDVLRTAPFDPQNAWHDYRFEVKGTTLKLFVDGGLLLSADDSRYLDAGQIGLLSNYVQLKISGFKIIAM